MKNRWCLIATAMLVLIFVLSCAGTGTPANTPGPIGTEQPVSGSIEVRVPPTPYGRLLVANNTTDDILIPTSRNAWVGERTFRFYKNTTTGWTRLYPIPGYLVEPIADEPGLLIPAGEEAEIDIGFTLGAYRNSWDALAGERLQGEFMVQVRYYWKDGSRGQELVEYSNPFLLGVDEPIGQQDVVVSLDESSPFIFQIHNKTDKPLWFPSICCEAPVYESYNAFSDDGYLSLQRQTSVGSYRILRRGDESQCDLEEPIQVDPGETVAIDAEPWFRGQVRRLGQVERLGSGIYRWEVVFYMENIIVGSKRNLRDVRHVFSEPFLYGE